MNLVSLLDLLEAADRYQRRGPAGFIEQQSDQFAAECENEYLQVGVDGPQRERWTFLSGWITHFRLELSCSLKGFTYLRALFMGGIKSGAGK